jgi:cbb3-type cytochrome oxidase subunit 3
MITILTLVLLATWYFAFYRNNRVHAFRKEIIDIAFKGDNWGEKHEIYHNGPGYAKMLYSLKPLKLESFYTPEEIEILNK